MAERPHPPTTQQESVVREAEASPVGMRSAGTSATPQAAPQAPSPPQDVSMQAVVGERVILNGSGYDMGDAVLPTYAWTMVAPPSVMGSLTSPDKVSPSFTPDAPGDYVVSLPTPHGTATVTVHVAEKPKD